MVEQDVHSLRVKLMKLYLESGLSFEEIHKLEDGLLKEIRVDLNRLSKVFFPQSESGIETTKNFTKKYLAKQKEYSKNDKIVAEFFALYLFLFRQQYMLYNIDYLMKHENLDVEAAVERYEQCIASKNSLHINERFDFLWLKGDKNDKSCYRASLKGYKIGDKLVGVFPFRNCPFSISLKETFYDVTRVSVKGESDGVYLPSPELLHPFIPEYLWKTGLVDVSELNEVLISIKAPVISGKYYAGKHGNDYLFNVNDANKCSFVYSNDEQRAKVRYMYHLPVYDPVSAELEKINEVLKSLGKDVDLVRQAELKRRREEEQIVESIHKQNKWDDYVFLRYVGVVHDETDIWSIPACYVRDYRKRNR